MNDAPSYPLPSNAMCAVCGTPSVDEESSPCAECGSTARERYAHVYEEPQAAGFRTPEESWESMLLEIQRQQEADARTRELLEVDLSDPSTRRKHYRAEKQEDGSWKVVADYVTEWPARGRLVPESPDRDVSDAPDGRA